VICQKSVLTVAWGMTEGFANLFMRYGPNTDNGSILVMIESQANYVLQKIERISWNDLVWIGFRPEPLESYDEEIQQAIENVEVWQASRVATQWPHAMSKFEQHTLESDGEVYGTAPR
jgi:hypothetical protein